MKLLFRQNGVETPIRVDSKNVWVGTRSEHTAAEQAGTLPAPAIVGIKDESDSNIITTVPSQNGTVTYNGTEQTANWLNFNSSQLIVAGNSATNVGTYTARFSPRLGYKWSDNTTAPKNASWTISKADADATLSSDSVTFNANTLSTTVTVTSSTGQITSVSSDDLSIATVSYSNGSITITSTEKPGTTTITISIAASDNYNQGEKTIAITNSFPLVYGVSWDGTDTTIFTRTDAATDFVDPVTVNINSQAPGSSPFDNIMPWAGMVEEERAGGLMVKIPKYWYKWTYEGEKGLKLQISPAAKNGFHVAPAHADRGDGKGERDYVYVGEFHCAQDTYKSELGAMPQINKTRAEFRTAIHNLGENIWQYDFAMHWTIAMLYLVEFADWNSQAKIGYGCGNDSSAEACGSCHSLVYHTGTSATKRTLYGHVRYRNIEGLWDNLLTFCDGIYFSNRDIYCIKNPANFSDSTGGTLVGARATTSDYISNLTRPSVAGFEYTLYPRNVGGSDNTFLCDRVEHSGTGVVLSTGGGYGNRQSRGLFCMNGAGAVDNKGDFIGGRIMELP